MCLLLCAQHGHSLDGVQIRCRSTRHDENRLMNLPAEVKVQRVIVGLEEPTVGRDKQSREAGLPTGPAKRRQTRMPGGVGGAAGAILPSPTDLAPRYIFRVVPKVGCLLSCLNTTMQTVSSSTSKRRWYGNLFMLARLNPHGSQWWLLGFRSTEEMTDSSSSQNEDKTLSEISA